MVSVRWRTDGNYVALFQVELLFELNVGYFIATRGHGVFG